MEKLFLFNDVALNNCQCDIAEENGHFKGTLFLNGVWFQVTLNPQKSGKYVLRGRIKVLSAKTGNTLCHNEKTSTCDRNPIVSELYCNQATVDAVKSAFLNGAQKMFRDHIADILRDIQQSVRPDTITACVAAILYAQQYLKKEKKNLSEKSARDYEKAIQDVFSVFPQTPMSKLNFKAVKKALSTAKISNKKLSLANSFWDFLIKNGHVTGSNCLPRPKQKETTPDGRQRDAEMIRELDLDQQDRLFDLMMAKPETHGGDCGVALMLWGGFTVDDHLKWKDLVILDVNDSKAKIFFYKDDIIGATHDFTRPLFPQATIILSRTYDKLLNKYPIEKLQNMPIIGAVGNPQKEMLSQNLNGYAKKLLLQIGIAEKNFPAKNNTDSSVPKSILTTSYKKNLYYRTGLGADDGVMQYMQGLSLRSNVTNDNYTSFSDSDAVDRIFTAMKAMQPDNKTNLPEFEEWEENGLYIYRLSPETLREHIGGTYEIKLNDKEEYKICAKHGVNDFVRVRELLDDGKLKRKAKSSAADPAEKLQA